MRLTISGAQSTGKSTLINKLFFNSVIFDRFKLKNETTRNLIRNSPCFDFGPLQINEQGTDITQQLICAQHLINFTAGYNTDTIYDRCALDGLVYTTYLYERQKVSKNTLRIAESIFKNVKYDIMFYIKPEFPIVEDGERSVDIKFRDEICRIFDEYINDYNIKIGYITGTVDERVDQVIKTINAYDLYMKEEKEVFNSLNDKLKLAIQGVQNV